MNTAPALSEANVMDRRAFVVRCTGAGAALILGGCVAMVTHPVPMVDGRVSIALPAFPDLAVTNGAIKLQPARLENPVYVLAKGDGEFEAVSPICTHRGCTVDVQGARLVCPCHGSTYDRSGRVLRGPAERPLTSYPVMRQGDTLTIDLGGATR